MLQYLAIALSLIAAVSGQASGIASRSWDCCKPTCGWTGKAAVSHPAFSCDKSNHPLSTFDAVSGCNGGTAYTCSSYQPFAINSTLAYGFAAVSIAGSGESDWCCQCYELTFTSAPVAGQKMVVQAISTDNSNGPGSNMFDLLIPGGGTGIYSTGCSSQYGTYDGGSQYGGVSSQAECANLPTALRPGCNWRFNWFKNANAPNVYWKKATCPMELVVKTGCTRN